MASSWRYPKRSKNRAKVSDDPEDFYCLDAQKTDAENAYEIYMALACRDTRDTKRLFLLNGLATLCQMQNEERQQHKLQQQSQPQTVTKHNLGFSTEELLYCLSASLVHSFTQVRAAALRTMRYVLATPKDVKICNSMQLQHLLCRSIDVLLKNDDERVQALKLIRKMLIISPTDVSPVLVRCLVSLAESGIDDGDSMLRACLATLCEFTVLNPTLLIVCGGVTAITRNVLECHNPRIAESLSGVLLYLLEWPQTRNLAGVRLDCLAAPYCDFTYRLGIMDKNKDARELRYTSCRLALLSVLRSWTGTIEFCDPSKPSGLKAIVDTLYLNQMEIRKAILDLLYELLGLSQPVWTDDYSVALQAVDPSDFQDAWLLSNGFVAMEGRCILPSLAARAPNVCEQHMALLLYCFLETGLLNAIVEVIASSDAHLSVRATVLIGKILQLMHTHLPADICSTSPALPTLVSHATQGNQHATAAVSALQNYQKMLRNRPAACSLFLDSIIQAGSLIHTRLFRRDISAQTDPVHASNPHMSGTSGGAQVPGGQLMTGTLERTRLESVSSSDESSLQSSTSRRSSFRLKRRLMGYFEKFRVMKWITDSEVLIQPDSAKWDWDVIVTLLRSNLMRKMDEQTSKFLKQLVQYFKPSSNRFSHQDFVQGRGVPTFVVAGLDLIDWLLASNELESMRILTDFFTDISQQLLAVSTSNRAHDCLFSPQHMNNTMCQQYFLYIGRMSRVQKGISILTNTDVFKHMMNLVCNTDHLCYIKLIVSALDYTSESVIHKVLQAALTASKIRAGRLYATQFLTVLLRARLPNFEVWGIPLIIQQTKDPERSVVLAAMDVLEEACHEKYYLEEIVSDWPMLKSLGDPGRLLMARYYSLSRGLNHLKARIQEEIEYWKNGYNKRYVLLVEADTHSSLTLHVRNEDGYYSRRNCNTRPMIIPPNIPPHLYGQMVQTEKGTTALQKHGDLGHLVDVISRGKCSDDAECLELKAAIWAVAHASTHTNGIEYFLDMGSRIYEKLVILATKCDVYSIRATCFNALGLIGGTIAGANILYKLNWLSVRHDRNTTWPVYQPEDWMSGNYTPVRHHYEDMPPYNYTGIEDQLDGSYYTGSYWNLLFSSSSTAKDGGGASASSEAQDANTTAESSKIGDDSAPRSQQSQSQLQTQSQSQSQQQQQGSNATAKSKTLPEGTYMRHGKHQRSLSESKTTDVISLIGGSAVHYQQRTRYNSCTDSNTSGVSSCESVTVRVPAVSDMQQFPLSPIPSMSNLLAELPPPPQVRVNLLGNRYLSPRDIKGYAQLRSLRRYCRPTFSESATDLYDIIHPTALHVLNERRMRKHSFESQRRLKVRSLDRQLSLRMITRLDLEELQPVTLPTLAAPKFLLLEDSKGPCYAGISLPKNLLDLFPTRNNSRTYVSLDIQDQDLMDVNILTSKQQFLNDSLNTEGGDESSVISSLSDVSSVSKRSKWLGAKHGRSNCLHCSRLRRIRMHGDQFVVEPPGADVVSNSMGMHLRKISGKPPQQTPQQQPPLPSKQQQAPQTTQSSSTVQLSDFSFHSPESILSEESMPDRLTANILYNVQRLANPVSAKQSKMALLEMKQKYPSSFQDICLYSEVCRTLGRSSYRMSARRFLQELFLDLNFESFYVEPKEIISKKEKNFQRIERNDIKSPGDSNTNTTASTSKKSSNNPAASTVSGQMNNNTAGSTNALATSGGSKATSSIMTASTSFMPIQHKATTHLKTHALSSVYETSCENLLQDNQPGVGKTKNGKTTSELKEKSNTDSTATAAKTTSAAHFDVAPPPAAPPPKREVKNELCITSDSENSDSEDKGAEADEVDSAKRLSPKHASSTGVMLGTNMGMSTSTSTVSQPTISSSTCSDQTINSSNRSSICTISHRPASVNLSMNINNPSTNTASGGVGSSSGSRGVGGGSSSDFSMPVENENKKYTRGRSYTLELDLSCTKNKFPITDRSRGSTNWQTEGAIARLSSGSGASGSGAATSASAVTSPTSPFSAMAPLYNYRSVLPPRSGGDNADGTMKTGAESEPENTTCAASTAITTPSTTTTTTLTITKSLAASLAKPIGSLYCEKRLQALKSDTKSES